MLRCSFFRQIAVERVSETGVLFDLLRMREFRLALKGLDLSAGHGEVDPTSTTSQLELRRQSSWAICANWVNEAEQYPMKVTIQALSGQIIG